MVNRSRRGASTWGCLFWMLAFAVVAYHGIHIGHRYFLFHQLQDEMRSQARLAPGMGDPVIRRRLTAKIDELGLSLDPRTLKIKRGGAPPHIRITAEYADTIALPLFRKIIVFQPSADEPL